MGAGFTERELDIMAVLWAKGPSTAAEVRAALDDGVTHNTVQKMLTILEDKGYVAHTEEGRTHRFHALVAREQAGSSALGRLIDKMFAGSAEALLTHFVRDRRLTRAELERVRDVLDAQIDGDADARGAATTPNKSRARVLHQRKRASGHDE
jgi:predicted transcriptional regulator